MTQYEYYMTQYETAMEQAQQYYNAGEYELAKFYKNAAEGYKQKALSLQIGE